MFEDRRKTITVEGINWQKYCQLKGKQILEAENGKEEMTFTEFANVCMRLCNPTLEDINEQRKIVYCGSDPIDKTKLLDCS